MSKRDDYQIIQLYRYLEDSGIKEANDAYEQSLRIPQVMVDDYTEEEKASLEREHVLYTDLYVPLLEKLKGAYNAIVGIEGRPFEQIIGEFRSGAEGQSRRKRTRSHRKRTRRNRRHKRSTTRRKTSRR